MTPRKNISAALLFASYFMLGGCFESEHEKFDRATSLYKINTSDQEAITQARDIFQELSEEGNSKAQYMLANMYIRGDGVLRSMDKALELLLSSSANGNGDASFYASRFYLEDEFGQKKDEHHAKQLLLKSARDGSDIGHLFLGLHYLNGGIGIGVNPESAINELKSVGNGQYRVYSAQALFGIYSNPSSHFFSPQKAVEELEILASTESPIFKGMLAAAYHGTLSGKHVESIKNIEKYEALISTLEKDKNIAALAVTKIYSKDSLDGKGESLQLVHEAINEGNQDPAFLSLSCEAMGSFYINSGENKYIKAKDLINPCIYGAESNNSYQQYILATAHYELNEYEKAYKWAIISGMNGNQGGIILSEKISYFHLDSKQSRIKNEAARKFEDLQAAPKINLLPPYKLPWY